MRIFSGVLAAALIAAAGGRPVPAPAGVKYASPQAAFEQGLGAYKSGYYEIAIPALEEAAAKGAELNKFFAEFYLARIYSDNASALDRPRQGVHAVPEARRRQRRRRSRRRPARALRRQGADRARRLPARGVREIGLAPDPERAVDYLHHAATFFGDKDAQFELAKVYLGGVGTPEDVKRGMHYLSVLTEEGYPGAQALLADLLWRGRYVKKDERRALALITHGGRERARARAHLDRGHLPEHLLRRLAGHAPAGRRHRRALAQDVRAPRRLRPSAWGSARELQPQRACGNGETVDINRDGAPPAKESSPALALPSLSRPESDAGQHHRLRLPRHRLALKPSGSPNKRVQEKARVRGRAYFGARLARMRCSVRRCMLRRRAVSETLRLHSS